MLCAQGPCPWVTTRVLKPLPELLVFVRVLKRKPSSWGHTCKELVRAAASVEGKGGSEKRLEKPSNQDASLTPGVHRGRAAWKCPLLVGHTAEGDWAKPWGVLVRLLSFPACLSLHSHFFAVTVPVSFPVVEEFPVSAIRESRAGCGGPTCEFPGKASGLVSAVSGI